MCKDNDVVEYTFYGRNFHSQEVRSNWGLSPEDLTLVAGTDSKRPFDPTLCSLPKRF